MTRPTKSPWKKVKKTRFSISVRQRWASSSKEQGRSCLDQVRKTLKKRLTKEIRYLLMWSTRQLKISLNDQLSLITTLLLTSLTIWKWPLQWVEVWYHMPRCSS
jgi:hypothetical protein